MSEPDSTEIWRPVVGYEGWYSVSNLGRVRRDKPARGTKAGKILGVRINTGGYGHVALRRHRLAASDIVVHKLVANAFLGSRPQGHEINHKNGMKRDNRLCNLEYLTPSQNMRHSFDALHRMTYSGQHHKRAKLTADEVIQIRSLRSQGQTQRHLAIEFQVCRNTVRDIVTRQAWTHI